MQDSDFSFHISSNGNVLPSGAERLWSGDLGRGRSAQLGEAVALGQSGRLHALVLLVRALTLESI